MTVPNKFPTRDSNLRIALIGEAPGGDEVAKGEPFVGMSGRFLSALLSRAGVTREACFLGNVCQVRPPGNNIALFRWDGEEIQSGLTQLHADLSAYKPNIVVLLGNVPLKAAKDAHRPHPLKPNAFRFKNANWRGSLFMANGGGPLDGLKCLSTYHPAYCLRDYASTPYLTLDLIKASKHASSPVWTPPKRIIHIPTTVSEVWNFELELRKCRNPVGTDIEGWWHRLHSISFSPNPETAYLFPFVRVNRTPYWTDIKDEIKVKLAVARLLEDTLIPKVWQNGLYDRFVLQYGQGIRVRNSCDDIMLRHWELNCEIEKALSVQASIYTEEPYYKGEIKSDDDTTFYRYNGKDSCVTVEINTTLKGYLKGPSADHYELNNKLLNPLLYMELRGIRYDTASAKARRTLLRHKLHEAQARFNGLCGCGFTWKNHEEIRNRVTALMCYKRDPSKPKKDYREAHAQVTYLLREPNPSLATLGEIEDLCEVSMNVGSSKQFIPYLYGDISEDYIPGTPTLSLPPQWKEGEDGTKALTADYEALLKLSKEAQKTGNDSALRVVQTAIELRALDTRQGMLAINADKDGRIRCGYNLVGSETGRITCYTSPTGSGYNLQTIPKYTNPADAPGGVLGDRDLFLADEGNWFFQCDLAGADGWTVAAYCKMLGDPTMLDDYLFGLKPAKILVLKLQGWNGDFGDRAAIKEASRPISGDDWDYFACKRVQHGAAYVEGAITISRNILKDSEGKLYWNPAECDKLKQYYLNERYPGIKRWHKWLEDQIRATNPPRLRSASGHLRLFHGRKDDMLPKMAAHEPQENTTYATNLAMHRLWTDPDNRFQEGMRPLLSSTTTQGSRSCSLHIAPLHQVHDALCGQFRKDNTTWATPRIKSYFDNPLRIAGQSITIPFEGAFGPSWGQLGTKYGGGEI